MPALTLHHLHPWNLAPDEAIRLQQELRSYVVTQPLDESAIHRVGGVDSGFPREDTARAVVVTLAFPSMRVVEHAMAEAPLEFAYIPGLLSFREIPAVLAAIEKLESLPDVLIVDGHGRAHPRRLGIASHLGVLLDYPTVGCAKSILVGRHDPLGDAPGSTADLLDGDELLGAVVRTRRGVKPVYVSVGHRVDLPSAIRLVLACGRGYRLPEPTRLADRIASQRETAGGDKLW